MLYSRFFVRRSRGRLPVLLLLVSKKLEVDLLLLLLWLLVLVGRSRVRLRGRTSTPGQRTRLTRLNLSGYLDGWLLRDGGCVSRWRSRIAMAVCWFGRTLRGRLLLSWYGDAAKFRCRARLASAGLRLRRRRGRIGGGSWSPVDRAVFDERGGGCRAGFLERISTQT